MTVAVSIALASGSSKLSSQVRGGVGKLLGDGFGPVGFPMSDTDGEAFWDVAFGMPEVGMLERTFAALRAEADMRAEGSSFITREPPVLLLARAGMLHDALVPRRFDGPDIQFALARAEATVATLSFLSGLFAYSATYSLAVGDDAAPEERTLDKQARIAMEAIGQPYRVLYGDAGAMAQAIADDVRKAAEASSALPE